MLMSTSFILSIIGAIFLTMLFIYYQRSVHKEKYVKTPIFYSSIFFITACLIHSIYTACSESKDMSLKNVFKVNLTEMKTGQPPF